MGRRRGQRCVSMCPGVPKASVVSATWTCWTLTSRRVHSYGGRSDIAGGVSAVRRWVMHVAVMWQHPLHLLTVYIPLHVCVLNWDTEKSEDPHTHTHTHTYTHTPTHTHPHTHRKQRAHTYTHTHTHTYTHTLTGSNTHSQEATHVSRGLR